MTRNRSSGTNSWDKCSQGINTEMSDYTFRTLYFPANRTRRGTPAKVTISIPKHANGNHFSSDFLTYVHSLSGKELRLALGDQHLEDLEEAAQRESRSLSNTCLHRLADKFEANHSGRNNGAGSRQQLLPFFLDDPLGDIPGDTLDGTGFGVTFRESRRLPVHSWYPYVEGFSAHYVRDTLLRFGTTPTSVYDPFGGAGTTQLAASIMGIPSYYAEVNPFMAFVAETKINSTAWARKNLPAVRRIIKQFIAELDEANLDRVGKQIDLEPYHHTFPNRDFFVERDVRHLLAAKSLAEQIAGRNESGRALLLLACAANVVRSSNMTRRADLRRRRPDEYKGRVVNVAAFIRETVERMLDDIEQLPETMAPTTSVGADSRQLPPHFDEAFDVVITSPPYLNGTNYIRNTKLELWYLGFLTSEDQLADFRRQTVCAGINDVSRARDSHTQFPRVEEVASRLDEHTKDRRIPVMVRHYFSDMGQVLAGAFQALRPQGRFVLDIGDSQFYGVHVPTQDLLIDVATSVGFELEQKHLLAPRYSRGDIQLNQFELVLRKPASKTKKVRTKRTEQNLDAAIEKFAKELPYKAEPYVSRAWGHPLHSLCSYQGKLKPALAYWLVKTFVQPGSRVLDPLGGVGTIPFEAALAGHQVVSNDKSPFASLVAAAKLNPPTLDEALAELENFNARLARIRVRAKDYEHAQFGLNSSVSDYYHPETLDEVLKARRLFLEEGRGSRAQTFLWASLLHILHGNRPYALSRRSHPVTPFRPTGPAEPRPLIPRLKARMERALAEPLPESFQPGEGLYGDFREIPAKQSKPFDAIITSPPFMGMRFDRPNWLRLWFCGWEERTFHEDSLTFLEREQTRSLKCYEEFFGVCRQMLTPDGLVIIHIGSGTKDQKMVPGLLQIAAKEFNVVADVREDVQAVEKHGLKDKGRTEAHHLLFLRPRD